MAKATIREIAMNLWAEENIDFTDTGDGQATPSESLYDEGYSQPFVSGDTITYEKNGMNLEVAEVCAYLLDEDGDETDEIHTLDYMWAITDESSSALTDGSPDAEDLKKAIRKFMA